MTTSVYGAGRGRPTHLVRRLRQRRHLNQSRRLMSAPTQRIMSETSRAGELAIALQPSNGQVIVYQLAQLTSPIKISIASATGRAMLAKR